MVKLVSLTLAPHPLTPQSHALKCTAHMHHPSPSSHRLITPPNPPPPVSRFQLDVLRAIRQLGYPPSIATLEHSCEYTIDIAMPHCMVAIEVDGPLHFYRNRRELQARDGVHVAVVGVGVEM